MSAPEEQKSSEPKDDYPPEWQSVLTPTTRAALSPAQFRKVLQEFDRIERDENYELRSLALVFGGEKTFGAKMRTTPRKAKRTKKNQ